MALQPATRRLLTEAAAAAAYQPKGSYQPAGSYVTTNTYAADKGAANGIATLGADGRVPAAQLPAANAGTVEAYLTAGYQQTATAAGTAVPGLQVDGIGTGLWRVELIGMSWVTNSSAFQQARLVAANGLVAANSNGAAYATPATSSTSGWFGYQYANTGGALYTGQTNWTSGSTGSFQLQSGAASVQPFAVRGTLRVTTAGSLRIEGWASAASSAWLDAGTVLRAVKIG
jgi:hypothetical protein